MKIAFITLGKIGNIKGHGIYTDLLHEFKKNGHEVYIVSPLERREKQDTRFECVDGYNFLRVKVGNITKCGTLEKGISTVLIEHQYVKAIKKYLKNVKFDLVLYTTPPITLYGAVNYLKKRDNAFTYLLLKDIFPQNAVDLHMMSKTGIKGLIYKFFRNKEKKLYKVADYIGCMSKANVDYILNNNSYIDSKKVEICPNCVEPIDMSTDKKTREEIRNKYNIPLDKKVFIYGGNLGKPQGIDFIISCIKEVEKFNDIFFLIVGDGTGFNKIDTYINSNNLENVRIMKRLPKEDYDKMVGACDVGLIFLDYRFTIPNFPSRLLSYMQAKIPVLAVTDSNTDCGKVICDGGFGWWCESNDPNNFYSIIPKVLSEINCDMKEKEYNYLMDNYSIAKEYDIIFKHFKK